MRKLLREPLLHFMVLGLLLFLLYGFVNRDGVNTADEIVVDDARVAVLAAQFSRVWQREPTRSELQSLIDNWVRDEVYYREGMAGRMELDDEVIRRRIVQKVGFLAEGMSADVPTQGDLEAWLAAHPDKYRLSPIYNFRQVYFQPERHVDLMADARSALAALERDPDAKVGDSTLLPGKVTGADTGQVQREFGNDFATALAELPIGTWSGPVASGFGVHLVLLEEKTPGREASLTDVQAAVERDLLSDRSRKASEDYYQALRSRHPVRIAADLSAYSGPTATP